MTSRPQKGAATRAPAARHLAGPARFGRREIVLVLVAAALTSLAMNLHLLAGLDDRVPANPSEDVFHQAWILSWVGHAATSPADVLDSNTFWPEEDSLARSELMIGFLPAALIGEGPTAAIVRYNVLVVLSFVVAAVAAYFLARQLGAAPPGAAIAGLVFAFAPWRFSQMSHLHVLWSGLLPLALFLLVRGYARARPSLVVAGWVAAAWQLTLSATVGLYLVTLLGVLGVLGVLVAAVRRVRIPRRILVASVVGVAVLLGTAAALARAYDAPEAAGARTEQTVYRLSPPPSGLLAAPEGNVVWGNLTAPLRARMRWHPEQSLFPGAVALGLGIVGVIGGAASRRYRLALLGGLVVATVLSLGTRMPVLGFVYEVLADVLPGWDRVRAPGRLTMIALLFLGLLAGTGADRLARVARGGRWAAAVPFVLALGVLMEGLTAPALAGVPARPPALDAAPGPRLHLPRTISTDAIYMLWSTEGFPRIVNGYSSFDVTRDERLAAADFPDARSVRALQSLGVRTVVLHLGFVEGTPWEGAADRPVDDLPLTREMRGDLVIYRLDPP